MENPGYLTVDGRPVAVEKDTNLLQTIRRAGVEIPTFCYHSELSVYGACRLCLVDVDGRGIVASCSTAPEAGMVVRTRTPEIREMRKITIELLLANHDRECTTCAKSADCKLLDLARRLGVDTVRFRATRDRLAPDDSNPSIVRDPNKCVLCGDCVRVCHEVQTVGAIDFAERGAGACVTPAFGRNLGDVECVFCGQCARVCPTGAILPRSAIEEVRKAVDDPEKIVIAQVAPAVRVAAGEAFGFEPGTDVAGRIVAALKAVGVDYVFDTAFTADLTVVEEATEFLGRRERNGVLPQFTSCCPGWVLFAERYYPELLPNLSTCRSPQAMFGALAKEVLAKRLGVPEERLTVVSIMPCTAKKFEATREELGKQGKPDTDHVLTTREFVRMVEGAGLRFADLEPESFDMPFGFKTGAGVIFGNSGGVSEAVLRYAAREAGHAIDGRDVRLIRGEDGLRVVAARVGDAEVKVAVVHGLGNARKVAEAVRNGTAEWDLIEVMACPGGCIGGAGQPVSFDAETRRQRAAGLYRADRRLELHDAGDNPFVRQCYETELDAPGSRRAHGLLHTAYGARRRMQGEALDLTPAGSPKVRVKVCVGTACFLRGSRKVLEGILDELVPAGLADVVDVKATFCHETCDRGPTVMVNDAILERCTAEQAIAAIRAAADEMPGPAAACADCARCAGHA